MTISWPITLLLFLGIVAIACIVIVAVEVFDE